MGDNTAQRWHEARLARAELMAAKARHAGKYRAAEAWRNEYIRLAILGGWPEEKGESK